MRYYWTVVQWSVHWNPTTGQPGFFFLAGARALCPWDVREKMRALLLGLAKSIYYFSELVCSVLSLDGCLIKINYGRFCVCFDAWRKWSPGVICVWPRTKSNTIVSMFIWFCYLELMIHGIRSKFIWCDLRKSKIYQVEGTVFVPVLICVNKINTYRL